jgi:flagellar basal body rod protein FlgF
VDLTGKLMMSRVMTLGALTFSLFLLGLLFGGGISADWMRSAGDPAVAKISQADSNSGLAAGVEVPGERRVEIAEAGTASAADFPDGAFVFPASYGSSDDDEPLAVVPVAAISEKAKRETEQRIRRVFPEADAETVSAWAETLQDMPAREQEDLLQQKRAVSGSLNSIFTPSLRSPTRALPPLEARAEATDVARGGAGRILPNPVSPTAAADRVSIERMRADVLMNLRQLRCVGYRALLVLPAATQQSAEGIGGQGAGLRLRSFEPGRRIPAAVSLAVSLPDDGGLWLQLSNGLLTRRGDLQRAADGTGLGLMVHGEFQVLAGSWSLMAGESLTITEQGEVLGPADSGDAATERRSCGRLPVVRINDPAVLQSDDGVHFRIADGAAAELVSAGDIRVLPGTLELSNVNIPEEQALLNSLPVH